MTASTDRTATITPSPATRIFAARMAFQMRPAAKPGLDSPLTVLVSFLEGLAEHADPALAAELANGVDLAMAVVAS